MNTNQTPAASASRHTPEHRHISIAMAEAISREIESHKHGEHIAAMVKNDNMVAFHREKIIALQAGEERVNALAGMEPGAVAGVVMALDGLLNLRFREWAARYSQSDIAMLKSKTPEVAAAIAALAALKGGAK